jgi:alpha-D-ribose 1-methylphosphonate 5-triphosphate diphosphatase
MRFVDEVRIVTADRVIDCGRVTMDGGLIVDVTDHGGPPSSRWLLPGLVDLHCDAIEKVVEPRPGVRMPLEYAVEAADRLSLSAGILTPFYSLSFSEGELGVREPRFAADIVRRIAKRRGTQLIDSRIHCRYEVTDTGSAEILDALIREGCSDLLSFMDHSPGQGQFRDLEAYADFLASNYDHSRDKITELVEQKREAQESAVSRVEHLAATAREHNVPLAGHDDDSPHRVETMRALGATISEFPVNEEAARAAVDSGMGTIFGAPNLVRGASQSGNILAVDAIRAGVATSLCADYVPGALLPAVFLASELTDLSLPQAIALATRNPARMAGLHDRGEIAPGLRADLIVVEFVRGTPQVVDAWVAGRRVMSAHYPTAVLENA